MAIHDTMRYIGSDVSTIGFGGCMGMAGFLLAMGQKGKRFALKNTRIMLHHPAGAARGQASDIHREAKELLKIRDHMDELIAQQSGQPFAKVSGGALVPFPMRPPWLLPVAIAGLGRGHPYRDPKPTRPLLGQVAFDLRRNLYMTTDDALEYGVIDTIVKPLKGRMKATATQGTAKV